MRIARSLWLVAALALLAVSAVPSAHAGPNDRLTWAVHFPVDLAQADPGDRGGVITPFIIVYALHDAVVKPMPGQAMAPSLAESWTVSKDGLVYEFVLRQGVRFHNGDVMTAEDVKFSFGRYRGSGATLLKDRVAAVEIVDPHRIRFRLRRPWPDFMTFYATPATGAAWVVPKKYVEMVGEDGFRKAPVGAGPYKLVSFRPGVELVLEAHEHYWRKTPAVKTLVLRVVLDEAMRLDALKRGEVDIAYSITGAFADELTRTPGLTLRPTYIDFTAWLYPVDQWDAASPWHDRRVRLAASLAIDRAAINQATYRGHARVSASIIPHRMEYSWAPPAPVHDPERARTLLAEAGYPNGFDAGETLGEPVYGTALGAPAVTALNALGIRTRLRVMERSTYYVQYAEKKLRGLLTTSNASFGNAATRLEAHVAAGGRFVYGSHPDIEGLFAEQLNEPDLQARARILARIQQLVHERTMFIPLVEPVLINGVGRRVEVDGLNAITGFAYSAPYEDLRIAR